jgi:hypothetical protein
MKKLLQRIFLSSEPDNEDLKVLVYDCLYIPWLKGDFLPEFAPEYTGSYLIALQKPSGVIRGIAPVDIWRRATGNAIVQATQKIAAKACIDTYPNFKQLALSKDGAFNCLYFLNAAYSDPTFTSAEDAEDPMVIMKLDTKNAFDSLCARLVLDVLSGKASRDYACGIKVDEDFETAVHESRAYFGFFKLARTCESILRFSSYDGATNYLKHKTEGLQGDPPEFMAYCIFTLHLWGRIFKSFPELRGLAYADDETTIGRLSQVLKLATLSKPVFKLDGNLDFNMGKTEFLAKGPTALHVYERAQYFLQTDPDLQGIANDFTPEMFTVKDIEVLGTPLGTDVYIRDFVAQNCIKIMRDVEKLEPLTDGFTHFQLVQKTMNTRTQYMSANITLPPQEQF